MKFCAFEKLSTAFIERLSSKRITVLAGTSPEAAESLFSSPQLGRKPSAPSPVKNKHAKQSSHQKNRVF